MDRRLLDILACPVTHQALLELDANALAALNARIEAGSVSRADGSAQREPLDAALATGDGQRIYRVDDGIPVLLAEEAILRPAAA
jgi:uncharacterized protein YbaR (Trm112 family)